MIDDPHTVRLQDSFVLIHVDDPRPDERLLPGLHLRGSGWVIAEQDVTQVAVSFGGRLLGYATYGEPRPEVAERFPHYPQSDASGFSFNLSLGPDAVPGTSDWIVIDVLTADGAVSRKSVPVRIAAPEEAMQESLPARHGSAGAIRLSVEHARVDEGGLLRVSGWAISPAPLKALEIFFGEEALGAPETGISRPDVALVYPDYELAATSGFKLVQDIASITVRHPVLRVRATGIGGVKRQVIVPVALPERARNAVDPDGAIHVCVDNVALRSDGSVAAEGWAVSVHGITEVAVDVDATPVGSADIGGARPDVGNRYPRIQSARRSGFSFRRRLDAALHGEHLVTIRFKDGSGAERVFNMPVLVEEGSPTAIAAHLDADDIRVNIDAPVLQGDRAPDPIRGVLTVAGWAVSKPGIEAIEVFLEDRSLGRAYVGMRREDIAAAFPDIEGALLSGFAITLPHRLLGVGDRAVRIVVKDKAGRILERGFSVSVAENEETIPSTQLRARVRQAEIDLVAANLPPERRPFFTLLIRSGGAGTEARRHLDATLSSLLHQGYSDWCALVAPLQPEEREELEKLLREDRYGLAQGQLAVQDTETAFESIAPPQSHGRRFVAVLRAGDQLGADALLQFAVHIGMNPNVDLLYCDERRMSPASNAVAAFFKPDWSPELLVSTNYLGRSWFASQGLVNAVGISQADLAGASDFDLALRLTEEAKDIRHVAQVLIDTAGGSDPDAMDRIALEGALARRRIVGEVSPGRVASTWRIHRRLASTGKVSIIIPTCASRGLIRTCLDSLRAKTTYKNFELIVLDNIPGTLSQEKLWVKQNADKVLRITEKFNWSRFNNLGAGLADGEFVLFLNDDIEVIDGGWLDAMLSLAERPDIGVVGPQLLYPDGKVQHAGMFLSGNRALHAFRFAQGDDPGYFGLALTQRNMIAVTGACMLSRREAFDRIGGFNEAHSVVNNDLDYCLRMWRANLRVAYTPFATLLHHELASRAAISDDYDESSFLGEWGAVMLKGDPFHNLHLATDVAEYAVESESTEVLYSGHPLISGASVKRILAVKLDHIGDFITSLPALRRLKSRFPQAKLTALVAKASVPLAAMESAIDEVIQFDFFHVRSGLGRREATREETAELEARLRAHHFDIALDLRMHPDTRQMLQISGARLLAGFDHAGRFPWLDVALEWEGDHTLAPKRTNIVDRLAQLVEAVGVACDGDRTSLPFLEREAAWQTLKANPAIAGLPPTFSGRPLVIVHPAVGNDTRQWPEEHFAGLIDLLIEEEGVNVLLVGAKDECAIADKVTQLVHHRSGVISMLGKLSLKELPMLLKAADLFVGNNSGPQHLAATLGVPTIGIHSGVVDATEWGPFGERAVAIRRKTVCSPCYVAAASDCHRQLACLKKLRPSDVYEVCRMLLGRKRANGSARLARRSSPVIDSEAASHAHHGHSEVVVRLQPREA